MKGLTKLLAVSLTVLVALPALALDKVYFYYTDPAGTPVAMTNDNGAVVWRAEYLPFGEIYEESGVAIALS